jgi:sugar phosphate isomerase/epimerase
MGRFIYTGFADEIDPALSVQMDHLESLGIKYIEARGVDGKNISDLTLEEARSIKKQLDERGFRLSALGSPIGKVFITDDFEPELAKFKHTIELAKIIGTDAIRIFSFYIPENENPAKYRDEVLRRMSKYVEAAKGTGIKLYHENERSIYGDTEDRCLDILESIGDENLSMTFDPANFVLVGVDTKWAIDLLLPYVKYMHIKDATNEKKIVPSGCGDGNIEYIIKKLKDAGFSGFLSLEPHLANFSGHASLEIDPIKLENADKKEKFTLAYNCLKKIVDRLQEE